jgi:hypothetical protein
MERHLATILRVCLAAAAAAAICERFCKGTLILED